MNLRSLLKFFTPKKHNFRLSSSPLDDYIDTEYLLPDTSMTRFGSKYGGWLLPKDIDLDENSVCYLAGAGEDISFDCELVKQFGCKVVIIDPTPRAIKHFHNLSEAVLAGNRFPINNSATEFYSITSDQLSKIKFYPYGLHSRDEQIKFYMPANPDHVSCSSVNLQNTNDYFIADCFRVSTLMKTFDHTHIDLLKIDIEGAEYQVLDDLLKSFVLPKFLLVEFDELHTPLDGNYIDRIRECLNQLSAANMRCISAVESNATFINLARV
jgi:FkbM family methyltransferase